MRGARPIAFLLLATLARADDQPAAAKPASPPEDSIAVAKRDFDLVKSSRDPRDTTANLELGSFSAPEMQIGGAPVRALPATAPDAAPDGKKKKSGNWLVDAMGESEARKKAASFGRDQKPEGQDADMDDPRKSRAEEKQPGDGKKDSERSVNPLDRYMAGWMTSQDFSLLHPGAKGTAAATGFSARDDISVSGFSTGFEDTARVDALGFLQTGPAREAPQAQKENPFLISVTPPMTSLLPPMTAAPAVGPPPSTLLAPPNPPAMQKQTATPEFVKPRDDEKYYKPMKRF